MQRTKINLERLLRCSERLADELQGESDRRRLFTYLSVLERYWHELDAARCPEAALTEYRRKIEHIGDLLDDEKLLAGSGGALARSKVNNHATLTREEANSELASRLNAASRVQQALRSQLMQHVEGTAADGAPMALEASTSADALADAARAAHAPSAVATAATATAAATASAAVAAAAAAGAALTEGGAVGGAAAAGATASGVAAGGSAAGGAAGGAIEAESLSQSLETQRELQEEILDDVGQLVAQMKDKALQAREAVRDDTTTLGQTGNVLDANQAKIDANNEALKAQVSSMRASTCMTWLMLLVVCALFVATFVFMKMFKKKV